MRRRSQAQQLLATRYGGVVDGLDVDVVSLEQGVTHLGVQLSIAHLETQLTQIRAIRLISVILIS